MASKRNLKKDLNEFIFDVVEELFDRGMRDASKLDAAEGLIDEAAEFRILMLSKISSTNSKKDFPAVIKEIEDKASYFVEKLGAL